MISNKNKVIVLLVSLFLIVGSIILILNKDEKIKKVESDSKKYLISANDGKSNNDCDMYFKDIENRFYNYDEVEEGYPLYIYNHCAWKVDALIKNSKVDDVLKESACKVYKTYINDKLLSKNDEVWSYNNTCGSLSGTLDVQYDGKNCSQLKEQIENDYVSNTSEYNVFKNDMKCVNSVGDIDKTKLKPYYTNEENCETLKLVDANGNLYNGVLKPGDTVYETGVNKCEYLLYFLNGYATSIDDYMNKTNDNNKKSACSVLKEYAQAGGKSDINNYNKYCKNIPGYQEIEGSDFTDNINQIHTTCEDAGDSESILTSKIETTFEYYKKHSNKLFENVTSETVNGKLINKDIDPKIISDISSGKSYNINPYVTIVCTENFQYTYPSIFETVKSGTYFELIYNPQIHSTYTCTQTFYNDRWERDYKEAIKNELLVKLDGFNFATADDAKKYPDNYENENEGKICGDDGITREIIYEIPYYGGFEFAEDYENKTIILNPKVNYFISGYCPGKEDPPDLEKEYLSYVNSLVDNSYKLWNIRYIASASDDYEQKYVGQRYFLEDINWSYKSILSNIDTKQYYELSPKLQFKYDNKNIRLVYENNSQFTEDKIKYNNDVYSIDDYNHGTKVSFGNKIYYKWRINGNSDYNSGYDSTIPDFSLYKYSPITRTKEIRLTYEQEKNPQNHFYADYQTGKITSEADTVKTDNRIDLGYVYPVDLNSSGERKISFKLDTSSGLSQPVQQILSADINNNGTYECSFQITNDAVIKNTNKDTSLKTPEEKYKVKFYVRPIATNNIDPNNRLDSGLLGANWASRKGQLLMRIIEEKSKGNNTYNPDNLEYSFTLSAQNIDKIREYNKLYKYDDFNLDCNNMGGECNSKFLNEFKDGIYGSVVNEVNTDGRNRRKYYINGKWYWTDSLLSNNDLIEVSSGTNYKKSEVYGDCNSSCDKDVNKCYECLYRKVNKGVLP